MEFTTRRPKVSVVIPAYNAEKWLAETVDSVINQTFTYWEAIIVDDGSTDSTFTIASTYANKYQQIKTIKHERNLGNASACNTAIANSRGEYIALLGSDDLWEPIKLEKQVTKLDIREDIGAIITHATCFGSEDTSKEFVFNQPNRSRIEILRHFFYYGNFICDSSALIRRSVIDDVGLYNPRFQALVDWDLWVRIAMKYNINMMEERLTKIRIRSDSSSFGRVDTIIQCNYETPKILDNFLTMSIDDFYRMVKDAEKNYGVQSNERLIPCMLATEAIFHGTFSPHLQWGIDTLYNELANNTDEIWNAFNYGYKDFHNMTCKVDVFRVSTSMEYLELKKKMELNGVTV